MEYKTYTDPKIGKAMHSAKKGDIVKVQMWDTKETSLSEKIIGTGLPSFVGGTIKEEDVREAVRRLLEEGFSERLTIEIFGEKLTLKQTEGRGA